MKNNFLVFLVTIMAFSLIACSSDTPHDPEATTKHSIEDNTNTNIANEESISASLDAKYLSGTWVWQEDLSSPSMTKMRSFELYADGTGRILSFQDELFQNAPITWTIENQYLRLLSQVDGNYWNCDYELYDNYLTDRTWSYFFAKETN